MSVALAAAGSGGHVFPALAVADALVELGTPRDDIVFVGGDRMEATTIPEAGYDFVQVEIHGIRRSLSTDNLRLPLLVRRARADIAREIRTRDVRSVAVFGGYVAGPAALAARSAGRPFVLHEANAVPGVANKLIARSAATVFTSFSAAARALPRAEVIGSPLRPEFGRFERGALAPVGRARYGIPPDAPVLGILGGSLGARFLNDVGRLLAHEPGRDFAIVHLTGPSHADDLAVESAAADDWVTVPFERDMVSFYATCDLVLSRGGALTVSELQATRTPAVVVPLPAGKAYQAENAADVEAAGGAVVLAQTTETDVAGRVLALMADPATRTQMAAARHPVDHGAAAHTMAQRILEVGDARH